MYIFDTSSLITLFKYYPEDLFPNIWKTISILFDADKILSIQTVVEEIKKYKGEQTILSWVKNNKKMFIQETQDIFDGMNDLPDEYKKHILNKPEPFADPLLIAFAKIKQGILITEERRGGQGAFKIPNVCIKMEIQSFNLLDFFRDIL